MQLQNVCLIVGLLEVTGLFLPARDVWFFVKTKGKTTNDNNLMKFKDEATLLTSGIDGSKPTVFEIHGFMEDHNAAHHLMLTETLVENYDQNVINVDWSIGSKKMNYFTARYQVESVGRVVAQQLDFLNERIGLNLSSVTLIGFSLGAHIAGFTGKNVKNGRIGKIVGLDPAGPLFDFNDPKSRLDASDADYVIALHTSEFYGIRKSVANADYFVNMGNKQPGCYSNGYLDICSHYRAMYLYIEELRKPKSFWFKRCINDVQASIKQCSNDPGAFFDQQNVKGTFSIKTNYIPIFGNNFP